MLNIAVCDDETTALDMISTAIKDGFSKLGCQTNIFCFNNGRELRRKIFSGTDFDVLFLDIDMEDIDGIELSKHLRENGTKSLIIFISNREEYVFRSFSVSPFRFIRKIDFSNEISSVLFDSLKALNSNQKRYITLETNSVSVKINPYEIMYVECNDKTLRLQAEKKEITIRYKISDLSEILREYGFIKVHKGYLVNYRYIYSIDKKELTLDNGKLIPISKYRLAEVKEEYRRLTV